MDLMIYIHMTLYMYMYMYNEHVRIYLCLDTCIYYTMYLNTSNMPGGRGELDIHSQLEMSGGSFHSHLAVITIQHVFVTGVQRVGKKGERGRANERVGKNREDRC